MKRLLQHITLLFLLSLAFLPAHAQTMLVIDTFNANCGEIEQFSKYYYFDIANCSYEFAHPGLTIFFQDIGITNGKNIYAFGHLLDSCMKAQAPYALGGGVN